MLLKKSSYPWAAREAWEKKAKNDTSLKNFPQASQGERENKLKGERYGKEGAHSPAEGVRETRALNLARDGCRCFLFSLPTSVWLATVRGVRQRKVKFLELPPAQASPKKPFVFFAAGPGQARKRRTCPARVRGEQLQKDTYCSHEKKHICRTQAAVVRRPGYMVPETRFGTSHQSSRPGSPSPYWGRMWLRFGGSSPPSAHRLPGRERGFGRLAK
ncbi:hypothetical protein BJ166DRAFT_306249 [Pestalotiopsis sp. NC0098]|nr:hypothetical protein BJ166DRAFT_306249 [Pestalotiopsis sp. NC0098]